MKRLFNLLVIAILVALPFVACGVAPSDPTPKVPGLQAQNLPSSFVFVEAKGNYYYIYKDENGYYLIHQDSTFAQSVHITWLGTTIH
jgi:hypothetical protein